MAPPPTGAVDRLRGFIRQEALFTKEDRLLVAVSGGLDSTVLATLLHRDGYSIALAHVNYGLRGEDSEADAAFVRELAASFSCPVHLTHAGQFADSAGRAGPPTGSVQTWARDIRYAFFQKILDAYNYDYVVTAHHLDDQTETFLHHLLRGTGLKGLTGIPVRRAQVRRPFLSHTRDELLAFAKSAGLRWREDNSNKERKYRRNRIRHDLVPALRDLGWRAETFRNTLAHLQASERVAALYLDDLLKERRISAPPAVRAYDLGELPAGLPLGTLLYHLLYPYSIPTDTIESLVNTESMKIERDELTIVRREDLVKIYRTAELKPAPPEVASALPYRFKSGGTEFELRAGSAEEFRKEEGIWFLARPSVPDLPPTAPSSPALHLRAREKGDRLQPFGLGGKRKKLQDVLVDAKIPEELRDTYRLLTDGEGMILAVVGLCITEPARVRSDTDRILVISQLNMQPDA